MTGDWVDTWAAAPLPTAPDQLPPAPFTRDGLLTGVTLRQTVRASAGGGRLRLCLSHQFGRQPLAVTRVGVALPRGGRAGVGATEPGTSRQVTFGGGPAVVVPPGTVAVSDPLDFRLAAGANLTVSTYLAPGQPAAGITSHPGSRTTSYLVAGDQVTRPELPGAIPVDHWYLLGGLQVPAGPATAVAVLAGDSLTDGRGSTTNRNDRWPDQLFDRLHAEPSTSEIAVLNHGVGGRRLLDDGHGPGAPARLALAALARPRVRWLVLLIGVNDIGTTAATVAEQARVTEDLIAAYAQMVALARGRGVRVYGATLPPFGGHARYDDPPGHRERARQALNRWIRTGDGFDRMLDFDRAVRDPAHPRRLRAGFDTGDHLHLSPAGYTALARTVPLHLFRVPQ